MLAMDSRQPTIWLGTEFDERKRQFSPDGHRVAYDSDESGCYEVYVRPFSPGPVILVGDPLTLDQAEERGRVTSLAFLLGSRLRPLRPAEPGSLHSRLAVLKSRLNCRRHESKPSPASVTCSATQRSRYLDVSSPRG